MVRTPRDYQEDAIGSFFDYFNKGNQGNPIISAATGCHAIDTEILMFDGSIKKVQDIAIGDVLMGDDCTPRNVLELKRGRELMYKITPIMGKSFVVNANHILSLRTNEGFIKNITVADYLKLNKHYKEKLGLYKGAIKVDGVVYKSDRKANWKFTVKPLAIDNYYGFTLDANHLYMTADFFVHHNSGKSLILAELIRRIIQMYPQQRIIMATHVGDLISNNAKTFLGQYPNADLGIYSAGLKKKQPWCQIVYGGIQSMYTNVEKFGYRDLLFIDEAHLLSPKDDGMYMSFIAGLKKANPWLKVIGLSATPWRAKGGSLIKQKNAIFTDIIYDISLGYLIKEGYLSPVVGKSSEIQGDLSGVKKIGGEFNLGQMEEALNKDELTKAAITEVEEIAKNRSKFLFFTSGIEHAKNVAEELRSRGWDCDIVIGSTKQTTRDKYLNKFRKTKGRYALVNNTVLTTGTDLPNCDCIVTLRGTQSSALWIQICGRGTRTVYADGYDLSTKQGRLDAIKYGSKPSCLLLDYAGNVERFGALDLIQAPFAYDKKDKGDGEPIAPPQKICPSCREPVPIVTRECHCGYEFQFGENIKHEACATNLAVISTEIKPVEHNIISVSYVSHVSKNGNPCLRIQYYEMLGHVASEYIMFGSFGEPRRKAVEWFYNAVDAEHHEKLPTSTEAALAIKHLYKKPKKIMTKKVGRHLEVVERIF